MTFALTPEQKKAVTTNDQSLLIIAGAGTGKTRVIVEKLTFLLSKGIPASSLLALTFTNKAADEMRERVSHHLPRAVPFIGTFHSFCVPLLREFSEEAHVPATFTILDRDACRRIVKRCMKTADVTTFTPRLLHNALGQLKTGLGADLDDTITSAVGKVLPLYTAALEQERGLDFDDLLLKTLSLLKRSPEVRALVSSRYRYLFIDEFQDTDQIQAELIDLLKGPETFLIAVGDTDQTIYTWRGATVHNLLSFTDRHTPSSTLFLTHNHRSTKTILSAANAVIEKNVLRQEKTLVTSRESGAPISLIRASDEDDEAEQIISAIETLCKNGTSYGDIAILYRANFQARALETQFLSHRIPYTVLGVRFFDRAEIKDLLAYLTLIQNPSSREAFIRAASVPRRGIGAKSLDRVFNKEEHLLSPSMKSKLASLRSLISHLSSIASHHPVSAVLRETIQLLSFSDHLHHTYDNAEDRLREVAELLVFAERFSHLSGAEGIAQLLAEVALSSEQDSLRTSRDSSVRLMTVHAAKGLEFPHVFLAGMEEGLFPFSHDEDSVSDPEEERRLCYVAITRAKDTLHCSYATRRGIFGSYRAMRPSQFLLDIPEHLTIHTSFSSQTLSVGEEGENTISW